MRRITSVLDSSYIGLLYWTAWQAPKNIVSSSLAPHSWEASPSTPFFVVSVLRSRDGCTDPLLRCSPRLFSSPHPSSVGDLWQYQIALSSHSSSFNTLPLFYPSHGDINKEHRQRCKAWDGKQERTIEKTKKLKNENEWKNYSPKDEAQHSYYTSYPISSRIRWTCCFDNKSDSLSLNAGYCLVSVPHLWYYNVVL